MDWVANDGSEVLLTFTVDDSGNLRLPEWQSPARADELWRTTCFEMFWQADDGTAYIEFNFSPSLRWAAYSFEGYRGAMREHPMMVDPMIETSRNGQFALEVDVDLATLPTGTARIGLSAVIEESDGAKSYWALAHPPGKPDFHHPDCFALELPAVATP